MDKPKKVVTPITALSIYVNSFALIDCRELAKLTDATQSSDILRCPYSSVAIVNSDCFTLSMSWQSTCSD